jgi:hypothetical protein
MNLYEYKKMEHKLLQTIYTLESTLQLGDDLNFIDIGWTYHPDSMEPRIVIMIDLKKELNDNKDTDTTG